MRLKYISIFALIILIGSFSACYKDKGNYSYSELNNIVIESIPDTIYALQGERIKITPNFHQENISNGKYSFRWYYFDYSNPAIDLSDKQNLDVEISTDQSVGEFELVFRVTDETTGVFTNKRAVFYISSKYSYGLAALVETPSGGDLIHISNTGEVYDAAFSSSNDGKFIDLPKAPLLGYYNLGSSYYNSYLFVNAGNDVKLLDALTYKQIANLSGRISNPPATIKMNALANANDILSVFNNKLYGTGSEFLALSFGAPLSEDYEAAPFVVGKYSWDVNFVIYDNKNGRFLYGSDPGGRLYKFGGEDESGNRGAFDLNKFGKEALYGGYTINELFVWIIKDEQDKLHLVTIEDVTTAAAAMEHVVIANSPDINKATQFVSSSNLPHVYYAVDNKVYCYDYKANRAALIYTFPSTEKATEITIGKDYNGYPIYTQTYNELYIATTAGNKSKVYGFKIDNTGGFENGKAFFETKATDPILGLFYKQMFP